MDKELYTYKVVYSDGVRVLDYIEAENLAEAKNIASLRCSSYGTAYYKVARCYDRGVHQMTGKDPFH